MGVQSLYRWFVVTTALLRCIAPCNAQMNLVDSSIVRGNKIKGIVCQGNEYSHSGRMVDSNFILSSWKYDRYGRLISYRFMPFVNLDSAELVIACDTVKGVEFIYLMDSVKSISTNKGDAACWNWPVALPFNRDSVIDIYDKGKIVNKIFKDTSSNFFYRYKYLYKADGLLDKIIISKGNFYRPEYKYLVLNYIYWKY